MGPDVIRQFERSEASLVGKLKVHPDHRKQLQFSGGAPGAEDPKSLDVAVVDIGHGGVGIRTEAYLPRNARFQLEVVAGFATTDNDQRPEWLLSHAVTARRCKQLDSKPTYHFGLAFDGGGADIANEIDHILSILNAQSDLPSPPSRDEHEESGNA